MSRVPEALYAKLTTTAAVTNLLSDPAAVFEKKAPAEALPPYVVFQKYDGRPERTYGASANRIDKEIWIVKAICEGETSVPADRIAEAIDTALDHQDRVIAGRSTLIVERQSDLDYPEQDGGVTYHHVGALYSVWTQPT